MRNLLLGQVNETVAGPAGGTDAETEHSRAPSKTSAPRAHAEWRKRDAREETPWSADAVARRRRLRNERTTKAAASIAQFHGGRTAARLCARTCERQRERVQSMRPFARAAGGAGVWGAIWKDETAPAIRVERSDSAIRRGPARQPPRGRRATRTGRADGTEATVAAHTRLRIAKNFPFCGRSMRLCSRSNVNPRSRASDRARAARHPHASVKIFSAVRLRSRR